MQLYKISQILVTTTILFYIQSHFVRDFGVNRIAKDLFGSLKYFWCMNILLNAASNIRQCFCRKCMPSIITAIPPPIGHATMKFEMNDSNEMSNFFVGNPPYWRIFLLKEFSIRSLSKKAIFANCA